MCQDDLAARCTRLGFDIGRGTVSHIETGPRGRETLSVLSLRPRIRRPGFLRFAAVMHILVRGHRASGSSGPL